MTTKTTTPDTTEAAQAEATTATTTPEPKKEVMGIERDDNNARISFTQDGNLIIVTMPIGKMPRALAHGFIYELHQIVNDWHEDRRKNKILTRDEASKFSFKNGVRRLFGK